MKTVPLYATVYFFPATRSPATRFVSAPLTYFWIVVAPVELVLSVVLPVLVSPAPTVKVSAFPVASVNPPGLTFWALAVLVVVPPAVSGPAYQPDWTVIVSVALP